MRTNRALPLLAFAVLAVPTIAASEPIPYSKTVQKFCAADYKKFCGDYGLEFDGTAFLHGPQRREPVAELREGAGLGRPGQPG